MQNLNIPKLVARKIVLPLVVGLGWEKRKLNQSKSSCCILNFHGVRKSETPVFNNRHMPYREFEKTIRYLANNFNIVSLDEIFRLYRSNQTLTHKTIALTFDDGYLNNFNYAAEVLHKYKAAASFFIVTRGLSDSKFYIWPDLVDLIIKYSKKTVSVGGKEFKAPEYYNAGLGLTLLNYLKTLGQNAELVVKDLIKEHDLMSIIEAQQEEYLKLVSTEQLSGFAKDPYIRFGSHTHSHYNLEYLSRDMAKKELQESKELLERILGAKVNALAFPDGSYSDETLAIAQESGYENLLAVDYRYREGNSNPNLLSRFTISNSTTFESNVNRLAGNFDTFGFN